MVTIHDQMHRILISLNGEMDQRMRDIGLKGAHGQPLLQLMQRPGITFAELARKCGQKSGSISRLLDRLEALGLCRRSRSSQDRRLVSVELTSAGIAKACLIPALMDSVESVATAGLTIAESKQLTGLMECVLVKIGSARGQVP